jgi:hypothetical protein
MWNHSRHASGGQLGRRLLGIWQSVFAILLALLVLSQLFEAGMLGAPGAPALLFWTVFGGGILLTLAHLPYAFDRWPKRGRIAAYLLVLPYLLLLFNTAAEVHDAWEQTPQGAAEAKQRAAEQRGDETQLQLEQAEASVDQARKEQEAALHKVEGCFTLFGHRLPALEDEVREGLGNPDSFKHVKTEAIEPDPDGYNVEMTFRAQNRMGALWTYDIRATVDPNTCKVTDTQGQPEAE